MFNHLAFNIAVLQVGEDIVQLFIGSHDMYPELTKHAVGGLRHFPVQDVKRQAVAQGQFTHDRLMGAMPGKGQPDDRAFQIVCQFGIEGFLFGILAHGGQTAG